MGEGDSVKVGNKAKNFLMNLKWQDYAFFSIVIVYLVLQIMLVSSFNQLPSPVYGGDYYYSMGTIYHVMGGGNPLASSNVIGSEPGYLPFYTIFVSITGWIFGLSAFVAMKAFAIIQLIIALILFYLFANYLFKNKSVALISTILYLPLTAFPVFKYTQFALTLIFPAFAFGLLYFLKKKTWLSAIIAGVLFGLLGITHSVGFISSVFLFVIVAIYALFFEHLKKHKKESGRKKLFFDKESFRKTFGKTLLFLIVLGIIGSLIAMLYWYKPIFVYHGASPTASIYTLDFSTFGQQTTFLANVLKYYAFDFYSPISVLVSLLFIIGIIAFFILKEYDVSNKFIILVFITALIATFHYFLTQPIIGTSLTSEYTPIFMFGLARVLVAGLSLSLLAGFAKKYKQYVLMAAILLVLILSIVQFTNYIKTDKWINSGRSSLSPNLAEMQKWVLQNTDVNDVFLSSNELSFALNGLTGRKEVTGRRAHNSLFLDTDKNQLAAAIMLYGNDSAERKKLLKDYNVKYLYWDYYWIQSEYNFDNNGKLTSWYDPLSVRDTQYYQEQIMKYNLTNFRYHTWLDPAVKGPLMKQEDIIFILPNQFVINHPWHPDLDNYLQEVWNFSQNNMAVSKIYRIVNVE
ncbi:hypothetical protein JW756_02790 [Candidatus Woesearchaeota archaeon]|nr:hypothetical protein [Candidatus Woesearchaeota archaeon]